MNASSLQKLTLESVQVRGVVVPLRRPIVAKVGEYTHWPFILIDVRTKDVSDTLRLVGGGDILIRWEEKKAAL